MISTITISISITITITITIGISSGVFGVYFGCPADRQAAPRPLLQKLTLTIEINPLL